MSGKRILWSGNRILKQKCESCYDIVAFGQETDSISKEILCLCRESRSHGQYIGSYGQRIGFHNQGTRYLGQEIGSLGQQIEFHGKFVMFQSLRIGYYSHKIGPLRKEISLANRNEALM